MPLPISQADYITYTRYIDDIKVIEQCCRKQQLSRIGFLGNRFIKHRLAEQPIANFKALFEKLSLIELKELKVRVSFVNDIHHKLEQGELKERKPDDCAPLAAEYFNTHLKTIEAWNHIFEQGELHIDLPNSQAAPLEAAFTDKSNEHLADEKSLERYFELLDRHPKLKREGELNDYTKGTYQIIYDPKGIRVVQTEVYQRLYSKAKLQELSHSQAHELATSFSRPGVVCEDQFWIWIRDVVISPQGYKHTYNRIVWKCDLEKSGGAAALPVLLEGKDKKFVVQLAFRHATNSWELEIPRGGSKTNETPIETARREILEETGYVTSHLVPLGCITPDSGLTASVVPVFLGEVILEKEANQDKTEAIKGKYAFTFAELMEGLRRGYMEIEINSKLTQVPIRDPFLAYALLMAK